jgi:hypothetical protein
MCKEMNDDNAVDMISEHLNESLTNEEEITIRCSKCGLEYDASTRIGKNLFNRYLIGAKFLKWDINITALCPICKERSTKIAKADAQIQIEMDAKIKQVQVESVYYFTFGSDSSIQPFHGGWVRVWAKTKYAAIQKFNNMYPPIDGELVRCAAIYSAKEFLGTSMPGNGNLGYFLHYTLY